jgi:nitrogen fixation/metabolism regulation signal transduction histidine kinase
VKLLANPLIVRMVLALVFVVAMFIGGVLVIRRLRKGMMVDMSVPTPRADNVPAFTVAAFHAVIQQLKDKEQELQRMRQEAQERASLSENVSGAVLTNLETGVVFFNASGLGQFANPAAREILGYATVSGMHPRDLFRGVTALRDGGQEAPGGIAEALERAVHNATIFRGLEADYATPSGEQRRLAVTVAPALGGGGQCYGAVCLVRTIGRAE